MRQSIAWAALIAGCFLGCGDDGDEFHQSHATPTATVRPAATPTPTPTPGTGAHEHFVIGSHHLGGGEITVHLELASNVIELTERQCLGGSGESCAGGAIVYSSPFPAFASANEADAEEHLQPLLPGTEVELELVASSPGAQVQIGDTVLNEPGHRTMLGTVPFHTHGSWQLVLPHDADPSTTEHYVTLRFVARGSAYEPSAAYTVRLQVVDISHAEPPAHDVHARGMEANRRFGSAIARSACAEHGTARACVPLVSIIPSADRAGCFASRV